MSKRSVALLEGVNDVLLRMGHQRVTALGATVGAQQAEELLDSEARRLQDRPWYFNQEEKVPIPVSALGWAEVPPEILSADFTSNADEIVVRDGLLYNKTDRTFAFAAPTNLLPDADDPTAASWVAAGSDMGTVTNNIKGITGPRGGPNNVTYLVDTSGAARQEIRNDLTLVDGTRYSVSAYFRNGPDGGAAKPQIAIEQSAALTAELGFDLTDEPPVLRTPGSPTTGNGQRGLMEKARLTVLDDPDDTLSEGYAAFGALAASWCFVYAEFVHDASLGDPTFVCFTHEDAAQAANTDMFVKGLQVAAVGDSDGGTLTAVFGLPYEQLPQAAKKLVIARAVTRFQDATLGSTDLRREFREQELEAWANLLREEAEYSDHNILYSSWYAYKFRSDNVNPLLRSRHGSGTLDSL